MDLKGKWSQLESDNGTVFRQLRFSAECIHELYLAVNQDNQRCLVLYLPEKMYASFGSFKPKPLANLAICFTFFENNAGLVIQLTNPLMGDLFDDLLGSLYRKIASEKSIKKCSSKLIATYWEWASFFDKINDSLLSKTEVKGIIGELIFLQQLLENTASINEVLHSWCGPFDDDKDFIIREYAFEVKTISSSGHEVRISSEYQLEPVSDKKLILAVVKLDEAPENGFSLRDKYQEVKKLVVKGGGDVELLLKRLSSKGLYDHIIEKYEHYRFTDQGIIFYNVNEPDFPLITRSGIMEGLKNISYNIELGRIAAFRTEINYKSI